MSLIGLSEQQISDHESHFLNVLEAGGGKAGNVTMRSKLKWPDELYTQIRARLMSAGAGPVHSASGRQAQNS